MEDIERYGDYNETDEEPSGEKSHIGLILKIVIISVCLLVVGLILFRVILFSYYPKAMKRIYFNDTLTAYYNENSGDINAEISELIKKYRLDPRRIRAWRIDEWLKDNYFAEKFVIEIGKDYLCPPKSD